MSCATMLMSVDAPGVTPAFLVALGDTFEKVVQVSCVALSDRSGEEVTAALVRLLQHPAWRIRLQACLTLITRQEADQRVISTLEAIARGPEGAIWDAETAEIELIRREIGLPTGETWDKLDAILAKARQIAEQKPR